MRRTGCMVWNERYRTMYDIDRDKIWYGCTIRDLLDARIAAGTFPLDPARYDDELRVALKQGKTFTLTIELNDGRTIAVINQPIEGGGWVAMHEDITERKRAERELEHTRSFLNTVIENVPSPIIVKDIPELRYLLINGAAEKLLGVDRNTMLNKTAAEVMPLASAEKIEAEDMKIIALGKSMFFDEHTIATPGNGTRIVTATRLPVMGADGKPQYLISLIRDVTNRKRHEQRIAHLANHDLLTDLPNRAAFNSCLAATLDLATLSKESFAVLCIDLDRFKTVNDVFGHAAGDTLLGEVARRLETAGQGAFLARVGGDEFTIITPTGPEPATAAALAERLGAMFDADIDISGQPLRVGLTIGVAVFPQDGADGATLIANAEAALFRAKSEARGSIRFFEPAMDKQLREKRVLQQDLRTAIVRDELDAALSAASAYRRRGHGLRGPGALATSASGHGAARHLHPAGRGERDHRRNSANGYCARPAARRRPGRGRCASPSICRRCNSSTATSPKLVHEVLLETGLAPSRLELEITEGVLIGDFNRAVAMLRRLKNLGVRIAMDDFGTGYSSLSYLQSFPFDKIKIDQTFVANLTHSQQAVTIVRAVIALGRGLDLPVVAEGVETAEQLKFLAGESCDEIQGYFVGRPQPIADYADVVGRGRGAAEAGTRGYRLGLHTSEKSTPALFDVGVRAFLLSLLGVSRGPVDARHRPRRRQTCAGCL